MKVIIIGPFPEPVHGMSIANQTLLDSFIKDDNFTADYFDTKLSTKLKDKSTQGKITLSSTYSAIFNQLRLIRKIFSNPGAIYYFTPAQSVVGFVRFVPIFMLGKLLKGNNVIHFHGSRFSKNYNNSNIIFRLCIKTGLRFVDKTVVLGESLRNDFKSICPNVVVCENGVALRPISNTKPNTIRVLFLSNLMREKGIFEFLSAAEKLHSILPNIRFDCAGTLESQYETILLEELKKKTEYLTYHGFVTGEKKAELFNNATFFVLPSYDEGQPISILEAYGHGCAVIASDVGGIPDIFNGTNGRYCKVKNSKDIVDTIVELIDSGNLELISDTNVKLYKAKYTEVCFTNRVKQLVKDLV